MKKAYKYIVISLLVIIIGSVGLLAAGFFAVRWGWTNVAGEEDGNSSAYNLLASVEPVFDRIDAILPQNDSIYGPKAELNWCRLGIAVENSPFDAKGMFDAYRQTKSTELLDRMLLALELRLGSESRFSDDLKACANTRGEWDEKRLEAALASVDSLSAYSWQNSEYWRTIKEAIKKDQADINQAALTAGIQPRLLVSVAIVEQLRLYYTQREFYEKFFKPLKILANANKMAWGVMSIKEKMAIETEEHLTESGSPFYLGDSYESLLAFSPDSDIEKVRYERLTNEKEHYYSYLYGSIIIRQLQEQWHKQGYDLRYRPEIIATLFNIGFNNSKPKADPVVGGSTIEIEGQKYFFGSLAYEFYYSGELVEEFPFE